MLLNIKQEKFVISCDGERRYKIEHVLKQNKYFELSTLEEFDYWNLMVSRHHKILLFN